MYGLHVDQHWSRAAHAQAAAGAILQRLTSARITRDALAPSILQAVVDVVGEPTGCLGDITQPTGRLASITDG